MIPLLLVRLRELRYAFYAQDVIEVVLCPSLQTYHSDIDTVEGMFRLGREWLPVVSLATLVNKPALESGLYDALVLVKTNPRMAIRVSAVDGVKQFDWNDLKPLDSPLDGGMATAARLEVEGEPVLLLIASELLLEKERQLLKKASELMTLRDAKAETELQELSEEVAG